MFQEFLPLALLTEDLELSVLKGLIRLMIPGCWRPSPILIHRVRLRWRVTLSCGQMCRTSWPKLIRGLMKVRSRADLVRICRRLNRLDHVVLLSFAWNLFVAGTSGAFLAVSAAEIGEDLRVLGVMSLWAHRSTRWKHDGLTCGVFGR